MRRDILSNLPTGAFFSFHGIRDAKPGEATYDFLRLDDAHTEAKMSDKEMSLQGPGLNLFWFVHVPSGEIRASVTDRDVWVAK